MMFSGFELLWLLLALGCALAGMLLTRRRMVSPSRVVPAVHGERHAKDRAICVRCAQTLDAGAHFCGACGLHLPHQQDEQDICKRIEERA